MGENSKIEWTQHTFQPWIGCSEVSPACDHCYARAMAKRAGWDVWGDDKTRKTMREAYWKQPYKWDREARDSGQRARVFCASMADVFEDRRELDALRDRLWTVIEETPGLDWLLLTKRPQNMVRLAPERWSKRWPANVWAGTTVEDKARRSRIAHLRTVRATVRFLSIEPLLEDLGDPSFDGIDWVIVGGESGPGARPFALSWARKIVRQCRESEVPCFVKQFGSRPYNHMDGDCVPVSALKLRDRKGGDPSEWGSGDWPREFPR